MIAAEAFTIEVPRDLRAAPFFAMRQQARCRRYAHTKGMPRQDMPVAATPSDFGADA